MVMEMEMSMRMKISLETSKINWPELEHRLRRKCGEFRLFRHNPRDTRNNTFGRQP